MQDLRIVIIGDDFTTARLFLETITTHPAVPSRGVAYYTRDLDQAEYRSGPVEEVREFLGSADLFLDLMPAADVLITTFAPVTTRVLAAAPSLRLIVCGRGGPINVDVPAATQRGIPVAFTPGRNSEAVAEFVLGLLLALPRRFVQADRYVRSGEWISGREDTFAKPTGPELDGRTLGIVGFGAIGARLAELAAPLHMRIMAHDPFLPAERIAAAGVEPVELDTLLAQADIISIHARPGKDARPIISRREFSLMRKGSYLINTSRAVNVSEPDLVEALNTGHLAGAALDVFGEEPLPKDHPLVNAPNVLLTPHSAGVSRDIPVRTARAVAKTLAEWLSTGRAPNVLNPEVLRR